MLANVSQAYKFPIANTVHLCSRIPCQKRICIFTIRIRNITNMVWNKAPVL